MLSAWTLYINHEKPSALEFFVAPVHSLLHERMEDLTSIWFLQLVVRLLSRNGGTSPLKRVPSRSLTKVWFESLIRI